MAPSKKDSTKEKDPKQASPAKLPSTPLRKSTLGNHSTPPKNIRKSHANQVKMYIPIPGIGITRATKPDGNSPAFFKPTALALQEDEEKKDECKMVFMSELRNPNGDNSALVNTSTTGKEYTHDIMVVNFIDEDPKTVLHSITKVLNDVTGSVKTMYQYGAPKFVNMGVIDSKNNPISHYLLDEDCITLIKRLYEGCDTKDEFMENPARDTILTEVFGGVKGGMSVIEEIDDMEWEMEY